MVEINYKFEIDDSAEAELFMKTVNDFVHWLESQDPGERLIGRDVNLIVRTAMNDQGRLCREVVFYNREGATSFLKLWRRVSRTQRMFPQPDIETGQMRRAV